jgi:hypothetical protein
MNQLLAALAACALLAPTVTPAQLRLGASAAVGFPAGDVEAGAKLSDVVQRSFPLELRAAWQVTPKIAAGLQGGYLVATNGKARDAACASTGADCTAHGWRLAARGEYGFGGEKWFPFAAALVGWEWQVLRWELAGDNWEKTSRNGWTVGFEAGLDHRLRPPYFTWGAFMGLSVGQYRFVKVEQEIAGTALTDEGTVRDPAVHAWFTLGLRGTFGT